MDIYAVFLILVFAIVYTKGTYKRWIPNTNFGNPYNWDLGRPPCGDDIVEIYDDSPTVYLQMNTTIKEMRLPISSDILLDSNFILGFTSDPDNSPSCLSDGKEIGFNNTYPSDWFDPKNWCSSQTETGNCSDVVLESELVPCSYDDVIFPKDSTFFVNLETGVEIVINTLKIREKTHSTQTLSSFMNSDIGLGMFPIPPTGNRSKIKLQRRPCKDPLGCFCGNDKPEILDRICRLQTAYCMKPACLNPILPSGGCCSICGAKLTAEYGTGFRFEILKNGLQRNYLDGKDEFQDVQFVVSRTANDKIQIVLTDKHGGVPSAKVALLMKNDLAQDISSGGFKYSLRKMAMEQSGPPTNTPSAGANTGDRTSGNDGEIAGIVIGGLAVVAAILAALYLLYRKRGSIQEVSRFKMFDRISFRRKARPQVEVPPFFGFRFGAQPENVGPSHQGFENPVYGNVSLENEKPLDLELMPPPLDSQEQPTFDISGFNNPLYDTYVQESPFSDPTETETEEQSKC